MSKTDAHATLDRLVDSSVCTGGHIEEWVNGAGWVVERTVKNIWGG